MIIRKNFLRVLVGMLTGHYGLRERLSRLGLLNTDIDSEAKETSIHILAVWETYPGIEIHTVVAPS